MTTQHFAEVLFGTYRRKVLALLMGRPQQSFYIREIARLTGVPAGSLHRELKNLADAGLLQRAQQGNQVRYQANSDHPIYHELCAIFSPPGALLMLLKDVLAPLRHQIDLAVCSESLPWKSGAGLLVVGSVKTADVHRRLNTVSDKLSCEIHPIILDRKKLQWSLEHKDPAVLYLLNQNHALIMGQWHRVEWSEKLRKHIESSSKRHTMT